MVKDDLPAEVRRQRPGLRQVLHIGRRVKHLVDALHGGCALGPHVGEHCHHQQWPHRREQVVGEGHDLAVGQVSLNRLQAAAPDNEDDSHVDKDAQRRFHD